MNKKRIWRIRIAVLSIELCLLIGIAYACEAWNVTVDCNDGDKQSLKYYKEGYTSVFNASIDPCETPYPDVETWTWEVAGGNIVPDSGHDGTSSSSREITFDSAGFYDVKVEASATNMYGEKTYDFTVFDTQLNLAGVADEEEESDPPEHLGAFIAYNNDDDDRDGIADFEDYDNSAEDDLAEIVDFNCLPADLEGYLRLTTTGDLKVWSSAHKESLVVGSDSCTTWEIGSAEEPAELWVEGYGSSGGQLTLEWSPDGTTFPGSFNADIIDVTAVSVDVDADGINDETPGGYKEESVGRYIALESVASYIDLSSPSGAPFDVDHPITLDVEYGARGNAGEIEIRDYTLDQEDGVEVTLPATYDNVTKQIPASGKLRITAKETSTVQRDITVILKYNIQGRTIHDKINYTVVEVDVDIYNGQDGALAPESDHDDDGIEDEEEIGAFTAANNNDTNGDNWLDNYDGVRPVVANGTLGRNEIDLMKLVLQQPKPADLTGNVRVTIVSGPVKIWTDKIKTAEVTNLEIPISEIPANGWWVEARSATAVQGIKLEYHCRPTGTSGWIGPDKVSATGISASCTKVSLANRTAAEVDTYMGQDYVDHGGNPRVRIGEANGTGVQPSGRQTANVILMEFTVYPKEIVDATKVPENYGDGTRARPYFDITRAREGNGYAWDVGGSGPIGAIHLHYPERVSQDNERCNDDFPGTFDETDEPTVDGHMWVVDWPGLNPPFVGSIGVMRCNFREFMRMKTAGSQAPGASAADPTDAPNDQVCGSRCSYRKDWYSKTTLSNVGPTSGSNIITTGNFDFEREALHTYAPNPSPGVESTVIMRGLSIATSAGSAAETVDLYLMEADPTLDDTLARYDGQKNSPNYDIFDPTSTFSKPKAVGKSTATLVGDQTAYTGLTKIACMLNGDIVSFHDPDGCGEGHPGDAANIYHEIADPYLNPESPIIDVHGQVPVWDPVDISDPLGFGANNATAHPLYMLAADYGAGTQNVTIELWENDLLTDDPLATAAAVGTRPADCIKGATIPVTAAGGGPVAFVITNADGTISGNYGTNEANEDPVQLYYAYDRGNGPEASPDAEVNVEQP